MDLGKYQFDLDNHPEMLAEISNELNRINSKVSMKETWQWLEKIRSGPFNYQP